MGLMHRLTIHPKAIGRATVARIKSRWEEIFFLTACFLLFLQVAFFYGAIGELAADHGAIALFSAVDAFVVSRLAYFTVPAFVLPLSLLIFYRNELPWRRHYLDILGIYVIFRLIIQLIGLNILVFDFVSSRFLLITQLLFFLPYSLMVWGWIYWRLDQFAQSKPGPFFRLDHDGDAPRPIDYFVAAFSSVFSASVNGIKGNSARARILILLHGFMIYDVMGLTLSRAVAFVQIH